MLPENLAILYIEDHPVSRRVMEITIAEMLPQAQLIIFEESADFISRIEALELSFSLVLLDIHLQPHDGLFVLDKLRWHPLCQQAKFVALTATFAPEELATIAAAGFDALMQKPINVEIFSAQIASILTGERIWESG